MHLAIKETNSLTQNVHFMLALPYLILCGGIGFLFGMLAYHLFAGKSFQNNTIRDLKEQIAQRDQDIRRLKLEVLALQKQLLSTSPAISPELQNHMQELQKRISELHLALYQQKKAFEQQLAEKDREIARLSQQDPFSREPVTHAADSIPDAEFVHISSNGTSDGSLWEKDDLTLIEGITPDIEARLNQMGIRKYEEIARWSSLDIRRVAHALELDPHTILDQNWVLQAQMLWYERYKS